ncbi:replicative DNA helicase [Paenibacillus crassostreae]|uniref:DNA 5'-3' helicase n=1 Tax=Paenibacillus crassostreae TaxID=1763538 RepID=A0A167C6B2_9BACL|nr:DnaB-like helicase C-terminal domain-containing protein [Paenibacillus crassostreae]AOZ91593.1 hypothetical protein LPB68_04765 [Paenibacillus crassostreae]OAB72832.1 hypothetical protein PNBC_15485 [Paenibacillus crassostreae]
MSLEAEQAVLGAILLKPSLLDDCYNQPNEFHEDERHSLILKTLKLAYEKFSDKEDPFDPVLMVTRWGKNIEKIGGTTYLMQLRSSTPTTANFMDYQGMIRTGHIQRERNKIYDLAKEGELEPAEVQQRLEELTELEKTDENEGPVRLSVLLEGHERIISKRATLKGIVGAARASDDLNTMIGGHSVGDLEIVAARPSVGKTQYIINDEIRSAKDGWAVAMFSLEMSTMQVVDRMIATVGGIDHKKIANGQMTDNDWDSYSKAIEIISNLDIYIDDKPNMTIEYIKRQTKKLKRKHPKLMIYVDYLQFVSSEQKFKDGKTRVDHISKYSKNIARELGVKVVMISAVGRECEKRVDKRPLLSDLRESGNIESDADIVIFLYRDDYYNADSVMKGIVELIAAKGRNVGTGTVLMGFQSKTGRFINFTDDEKYEIGEKVKEHERSKGH